MAELVTSDDCVTRDVPSAETWSSGEMRLALDGRVGIVTGCKQTLTGERATLRLKGRVRILAAATLSAGAVGAVHIANQTLVASGTGGSTKAGTVVADVSSGAYGEIDLNEWLPA